MDILPDAGMAGFTSRSGNRRVGPQMRVRFTRGTKDRAKIAELRMLRMIELDRGTRRLGRAILRNQRDRQSRENDS